MLQLELYPERVKRLISISACSRSHPYSIALRHTQRQVLMADPHWNKGFYYKGIPTSRRHEGKQDDRCIKTPYSYHPCCFSSLVKLPPSVIVQVLNGNFVLAVKDPMKIKSPALCPDFLIETYLDHQGERFCLQYDPNSLLYISKAMDMFDMSLSETTKLQQQRKHKFTKYRGNFEA